MEFSSCLGRLFHHSRRKLWAATIKWNFDFFFFKKIHRRRRSHFIFFPETSKPFFFIISFGDEGFKPMASLAFEFCLRPTGTTKKRSGLAGKRATALWRNVREPQKKERKKERKRKESSEGIDCALVRPNICDIRLAFLLVYSPRGNTVACYSQDISH